MQPIVSDASVIIDIECCLLTGAMFSLPFEFMTPDILFYEELEEKHNHLLQLGLISQQMSGKLINDAYKLLQTSTKVSVNDLLTLVLAIDKGCPLLTGDGALRKVAQQMNIKTHGTIWLVDQMIEYKKITRKQAHLAFKCMHDSGSRLPWKEIEKKYQLEITEFTAAV